MIFSPYVKMWSKILLCGAILLVALYGMRILNSRHINGIDLLATVVWLLCTFVLIYVNLVYVKLRPIEIINSKLVVRMGLIPKRIEISSISSIIVNGNKVKILNKNEIILAWLPVKWIIGLELIKNEAILKDVRIQL